MNLTTEHQNIWGGGENDPIAERKKQFTVIFGNFYIPDSETVETKGRKSVRHS